MSRGKRQNRENVRNVRVRLCKKAASPVEIGEHIRSVSFAWHGRPARA